MTVGGSPIPPPFRGGLRSLAPAPGFPFLTALSKVMTVAEVETPEFNLDPVVVPDEIEQLAIVLAFRGILVSSEQIELSDGQVVCRFDDEDDIGELVAAFPREGEGPFSDEALKRGEWQADSVLEHVVPSDRLASPLVLLWRTRLQFPARWVDELTARLADRNDFYVVLDRDAPPEHPEPGITGTGRHVATVEDAQRILEDGRTGRHEDGGFDRGGIFHLLRDPLRIVEIDGFGDREPTPSRISTT